MSHIMRTRHIKLYARSHTHDMTHNNLISIKTINSSHGISYPSVLQWDCNDIGGGSDSWVRLVVQRIANQSMIVPLPTRDIRLFRAVFDLIKVDPICRSLYAIPPKSIGRKEVQILFSVVEDFIARSLTWGPAVQAKASMIFRRRMIESLEETDFAESLNRHSVYYRTRLTGKHNPRTILSGEINTNISSEELPIDAIPHENATELKEKIKKKLDEDVRNILDACIAEQQQWIKVRQKLIELGRLVYTFEELQIASNYLMKEKSYFTSAKNISPSRLIGAIAFLCCDSSYKRSSNEKSCSIRNPISMAMIRCLDLEEDFIKNVKIDHVI
jgi:hypothetical protein